MKVLISGGSASGKSEYAENLAVKLAKEHYSLVYIATMKPFGEEAVQRIIRHQKLRATKGFKTIECYNSLSDILIEDDTVVLLECLSNLMANELFSDLGDEIINHKGYGAVITGVDALSKSAKHLIVVSNDIFSDGIVYEEQTVTYQKKLALMNRYLAKNFDEVVEIVSGNPIIHKRGLVKQ